VVVVGLNIVNADLESPRNLAVATNSTLCWRAGNGEPSERE
jgi:hypothetical protein